ncbi:MAG: photosynthetic complex putative assembly protein PuhB [Pseudomonadota bacterium]
MCNESVECSRQHLSLKDSLESGIEHPGLPGPLPKGEHVVWQGLPNWWELGRQMYYLHLVTAYFVIMAAWGFASEYEATRALAPAVLAVIAPLLFGTIVVGMLIWLARLAAKNTIYTVTNKRIVMRIGSALSKTIDIPFKAIQSVELKTRKNGTGNLSIVTTGDVRLPYMALWPHARPWRLKETQPMLRAIPNAAETGSMLAEQLRMAMGDVPAEAAPSAEPLATAHAHAAQSDAANDHHDHHAAEQPTRRPLSERTDRIGVYAAASLALFTVATVLLVQLNKSGPLAPPPPEPLTTYNLQFNDAGDDRIAIVDVSADQTITYVEPGKDGLIRGALRGLERARKMNGNPVDAPLQLVVWDSGRTTLSDLVLDEHIPIDSFGAMGPGAVSALLQLPVDGD